MAQTTRVQSARIVLLIAFLLVAGALLTIPIVALTQPVESDVTNGSIAASAYLPVVLWCLGCPIALARRSTFALRFLWTLGCVSLLLHIAVAFHLGHGWSHRAAWDYTRRVAGYGDGIFVSYAFMLVWLVDVVWAWVAYRSYLARPRRLTWAIHAFLAFIVFNAAFVFASREMRETFAVVFVINCSVIAWRRWRRYANSPQRETEPM